MSTDTWTIANDQELLESRRAVLGDIAEYRQDLAQIDEEILRRGLSTEDQNEPSDALVEAAAEAIWNLNPYPSWMTWEKRVEAEREHRGDKSWSGPVKRCRDHARAALSAVGGTR